MPLVENRVRDPTALPAMRPRPSVRGPVLPHSPNPPFLLSRLFGRIIRIVDGWFGAKPARPPIAPGAAGPDRGPSAPPGTSPLAPSATPPGADGPSTLARTRRRTRC